MNKYENPEINNNKVPLQTNMFNISYQQNEVQNLNFQRQLYNPGTVGLRNQGIAMHSNMQGHIQPAQYTMTSQNYQTIMPQQGFVYNQYYNPINMNNASIFMNNAVPTNLARSSMVTFSPNQNPNIYHIPVDKLATNQPQNYLISQNYAPYLNSHNQPIQQIQQIQHQLPHMTTPQMQPQLLSQSHQQLIPNQFSQSHTQRPPISNINGKQVKVNSALEIINPETKKSIDLTSFKTVKNQFHHNEASESKSDMHCEETKFIETTIDKHEYHNTINRNEDFPDVNKPEFQDKIAFTEILNDKKSYSETKIIEENTIDDTIESEIVKWSFDKIANHQPSFINTIYQEPLQSMTVDDLPDIDSSDDTNKIINDIPYIHDLLECLNNGHSNKFIYSREELIKIGKNSLSRQKPIGLPSKDEFTDPIILDTSQNLTGLENTESMQSITNQKYTKVHKISQNIPISWRHLHLKHIHGLPKYINLGNTENVLSKSDDGYITCKQRLAAGEELSETEELIRQIKGILNRIVPQNFDQCLDDLVSLKIGTHEGMTCLVNELFLKAVKEEAYSVTFAKICSYLASIKADVSDHEIVTFRSVLLQKCQAMFTTPLEDQLQNVREEWLLKASTEKPKTKALMESDVDEQIKKAKDRYYGNIRFIGELYLKGVLITKIICYCIENLLTKENDADSLICLCKLLETCGAKLETETKGKEKLNESFKKLRQLSESLIIETRVRFRILDIMEMRQKKWCLRKIQQEQKIQPKTLEEIKNEKEIEEEKEYYSSLNRKNINNWTPDRRPSLPNVNKIRPNFMPKQLSVTCCSNDSTTLGPQKRNWIAGSGAQINISSLDTDKRINKHRVKINSEIRQKDLVYNLDCTENILSETIEGCVSNYSNCYIQSHNFNTSSYQSANSSENSSRSSSHGRSTPQNMVKDKLPDSKLAQSITVDIHVLSPIELLQEYTKSDIVCTDSWNTYSDKVDVVYQWLDSNLDSSGDTRISLSNLLSRFISQNMMDKVDLIKAFSKLIDSLEDLIIDIGQSIWDSLADYLIPFVECMEIDSIDLIESIFDFEVLKRFHDRNAYIIYSLPWSMTNKVLRSQNIDKYNDIFKIAIHNIERLTICEKKLISIITKNLFRAINIVTQINSDSYLNWVISRNDESFNCYSEEFFINLNWEGIFYQIQRDFYLATRLSECFKQISTMSKHNEILTSLCKFCNENEGSSKGILSILRCLLVTNTYDIQTILNWELQSHTNPFPSKLKDVLTVLKNNSAFISDNSFECLLSFDESNYSFNQSTFDHDNCTNSD